MYVGDLGGDAPATSRGGCRIRAPVDRPFQALRTADGWITVACAKEKFWERLCEALGRRTAGIRASPTSPPATATATSCSDPPRRVRTSGRPTHWLDVLSAGRRPARSGLRGRRGARGSAGPGPRRRRRARASAARHRPPGRLPVAAERRAARWSALRSAASTPTRCCATSAATRSERIARASGPRGPLGEEVTAQVAADS